MQKALVIQGWSWIVQRHYCSRALYLKNGFVDIPRYNDNYKADVFMERKLSSLI